MGSGKGKEAESKDAEAGGKEKEKKLRLLGMEPKDTLHEVTVRGGKLRYKATVGVLPLKDRKGETQAEIFFTAYNKEGVEDPSGRPLTFAFNGGPGSSSIWLHMGALGPRRVVMEPEGWMPEPPYRMEDNEDTWLEYTDLVFIDPVGTGFSRAAEEDLYENYLGFKEDLESVGLFIRLYLSKFGRWSSPLYLAGESYGTTRAAGLAAELFDEGVAFNGIVLISTALDLRPIFFGDADDLPFQLFVPTYTATAWYHGKLSGELQGRELPGLLEEVEEWVESELTPALMRGDRLEDDRRDRVAEKLALYTGLDIDYVKGSNLRVHIRRFCKELLRSERRSVGRLDSRFRGIEPLEVTENPEFDPSMVSIIPPYTSVFNNYIRGELELETDMNYRVWLEGELRKKWKWEKGKLPSTGEKLRQAMAVNPHMRVLVAQGYFDLATPLMATRYMLSHMNVDPELRGNISLTFYEAGHMFYLDRVSLNRFSDDVREFMEGS
ncbi:MAG: peptidase S10 [Candidatus Aegiribacteria sp.]